MKSALRARLPALLLVPLFVYLLLPVFGAVWHSVVPEHEHMLAVVPGPDTLAAHSHTRSGSSDYSRPALAPFETVIHAFDPVSALQVFGIIIGLSALFVLIAPRSPSLRVAWPPLLLQSPLLVPLELPPAA